MIIERKNELAQLERVFNSKKSEFVTVYGRRRVGKTYLLREFFLKRNCTFFHATGLQNGSLNMQLNKFAKSLSETFFDGAPIKTSETWGDAFNILHTQVAKTGDKVVIFLDELPWMATRKSDLLHEIDYYWNHYWSTTNNIILVVCGSSSSWLIKKIIYNKGGLHNRTTCQMRLLPFSLSETREYLKSNNIKLNDKHILNIYMALGGVPYYLNYIEPRLTSNENIQKIIFNQNAPLNNEFDLLFESLFENASVYVELLKIIAQKREGLTRGEIASIAKLSTNGGTLSERLNDLCAAGFAEKYIPWGRRKGEYYKLIDEFCLFYLHWVYPMQNKRFASDYWVKQTQKAAYYAWSGFAFEALCSKHIDNIVHALKISSAETISSWRYIPRKHLETGAQIDLVIDRADDAITICEIKYTSGMFVIDKSYADALKRKIEIFKSVTNTTKQIFLILICSDGLKKNKYYDELVSNYLSLNDLFTN